MTTESTDPAPSDRPPSDRPPSDRPSRRGRPTLGERAARRRRVLDAAFEELIESGHEHMTMLSIAKRAGASKETLYSWFGNREGLVKAMIVDNADATSARVEEALESLDDYEVTLSSFGSALLTLLTNERSIALNRAAMSEPGLAHELLASGRHRVGPIVEDFLRRLDASGIVAVPDPGDAFEVFYGLLVRDTQIRVLLGEEPPSRRVIGVRAATATEQFFTVLRSAD